MYQRLFAWNAGNLGISGRFLRSWLPYKYRPLLSKVLSRPLKAAGNPRTPPRFRLKDAPPRPKLHAPMSKTVLGRGLGSLMNGARPSRGADAPAAASGVQLLLRGADGDELVPPSPFSDGDNDRRVFPSWALGVTLVSDLLLFLVAFWIVARHAGWFRFVAAGILVLVGGARPAYPFSQPPEPP